MTKKSPPKTHAERIKRERRGHRPEPGSDLLTPEEVLDWLRDEVIMVNKAAEMRIREVVTIASEYAQGEMVAEEANKRIHAYSARWREAIPGLNSVEGMTDEQILRASDRIRKELATPFKIPETSDPRGKGPAR